MDRHCFISVLLRVIFVSFLGGKNKTALSGSSRRVFTRNYVIKIFQHDHDEVRIHKRLRSLRNNLLSRYGSASCIYA